jgi:ADP-ribose pyrophosphatase YjhB (NUDIX family)
MYKIIIASGPVIVRDNKVLLDIQGEDTFWKFCGGKVRENETLEQTAVRRAKEELGINIAITKNKPFLLHTNKKKDNEIWDIILVHFMADFSGTISTGDEVKKYDWLDINNLPENIAPNIIPTLKHFGFIK